MTVRDRDLASMICTSNQWNEKKSAYRKEGHGGGKSGDISCNHEEKKNSSSDTGPTRRTWESVKLVYSLLIVDLIAIGAGTSWVFSSPLLDEMTRDGDSKPWVEGFDNCVYQSLCAPLVVLGGAIGALSGFLLVSLLGLVTAMIAALTCYSIGWCMVGVSWFVSSPILFRCLILTGRFVTGIGLSWGSTAWATYISEVAPDKFRPGFMGFSYVMYALGTTLTYLLGTFFPYWICAFIYGGIMAALIPFLVTVQKSPLRTRNVCKNIEKLKMNLKSEKKSRNCCHRYSIYSFLSRFLMVQAILFCHAFMGYSVLVQYVGPIFNAAGASEWNIPHGVLVALSIGGGDMIGSILSIPIATKLTRIMSAFIGAVGVCIGHIGIAVYFILVGELGHQPLEAYITQNTSNHSSLGLVCFFEPTIDGDLGQQYSPIALINIAIVMVMYGAFWIMQPYLITVELFSNETRDIGMVVFVVSQNIYHMSASFTFPFLEKSIGPALSFFILAFFAGLTAIFLPCIVPETKGRPMGERGDRLTPKQNLMEFYGSFRTLHKICF